MDISGAPRSKKTQILIAILKNLFLYVLVPVILLWALAKPVGNTVRLSSGSAVFWILLAALGAVCLNWYVYRTIHRKRPPLLVFAHGVLCLLAVVIIEHLALPSDHALTTTLATVGVSLALVCLVLLSLWFASCDSKPAHAASVLIRVLLDMFLCIMAYQVAVDIENGFVSMDTFFIIGVMIALVLGLNAPRLLSSFRRSAARRRATGLAEGRIEQILGETYLDLDGDPVTPYHVRIRYTVDNVPYETHTDISKFTARRFGRDAFVGKPIPVHYDPANPAGGFTDRIDRHFLDQFRSKQAETDLEKTTENI